MEACCSTLSNSLSSSLFLSLLLFSWSQIFFHWISSLLASILLLKDHECNVSFLVLMLVLTLTCTPLLILAWHFSFHLSLKVVLIYNKNKSLRVRQLGLTVSYQELNNVWWSWLSRILQPTPLQETELLSCEDFNIWKYFSPCTWSIQKKTEKSHFCTDNKINDLVTYSFCFELQRDIKSSSNKLDLLIFPGASMLIIIVGITGT